MLAYGDQHLPYIWKYCQNYHQIYIDLLTMLCPCFAIAKKIVILANIIKLQPDLAQITRFNDSQYFRIYGILREACSPI